MTKYIIKPTTQFKKDYKLALRQHRKIELLDDVIKKLASGEILPAKYKDHPLSGNWSKHRECHIEPDWLLIYHIDKDILVLTLSRTGTHNDLFSK
ncbi:MAG: type II toxin-antitoxin system YafQ family toxin [Lachnospiraceae bacterium]|nr:type II toxin-antitoxin system YafQ family toxin [Lachnospiraceae bacterium]